ncbi:alanyl-tRNA editing protein [Bacillus sp. AFS055030]|uniref:alanyl-tRNA editing protein n=1 Tax=Bacillus sp. AFS055030 TaxID=2033507 RepID=UPI000BFCAE15|nr:alanyl-tRNA editing protein [Bacillus sp. AFS055030]PGL71406.1 alanyl-tRNA editing protein [Bacillus sp. AFS055030]
MCVKKLFWEDPYLAKTSAIVTEVEGSEVTLNQTIIYAFSGGQQSDAGRIGNYEVIEARKNGLDIIYTLPEIHDLQKGQEVVVEIDWEKRYRIMKLHFAAEIILELMYQNYNNPEKIGANITSDKARIDFYWDGKISDTFPFLEKKAKELIDADLEIISEFDDLKNQRRYWEIKGFGKVSCGGTHIKRTGEIKDIKLKRNNIGGGKERIEIYLI